MKMEYINNLIAHHIVVPQYLMWIIFGTVVFTLLFLDLFVFHRKDSEPNIKSILKICVSYVLIACLFGLFVIYEKGVDTGMLFYTGYLVEFSLSIDNVFVISLIFTSLRIPRLYQHRVLFWGIMGAIVLRALMIFLGETLIENFHWILYVFSVFLLYTGFKMLGEHGEEEDAPKLSDSKIFKFIESHFNVLPELRHEHFFVKENGKHYITPLFFALITIEIMDVIFALDSIPAIFLITQDVFVVYTSNIFAILGLRSLYFLLAEAVHKFKYLKQALAVILMFIGSKIFLPYIGLEIAPELSLVITFAIIFIGIGASLARKEVR